MSQLKSEKLGMPIGTARARLIKDILWKYVVLCGDDYCYRCGHQILNPLELSIEHKNPWGISDNPLNLYFDLENIAFSHIKCNSIHGSNINRKHSTDLDRRKHQRSNEKVRRNNLPTEVRQEKRRQQYKRTGK